MKSNDPFTEKQLQNLGKRLRALRIAKGYSNFADFAYESSISRSQYGRYERGEDIRFSTLMKVLKALDISVDEFFSEGFS